MTLQLKFGIWEKDVFSIHFLVTKDRLQVPVSRQWEITSSLVELIMFAWPGNLIWTSSKTKTSKKFKQRLILKFFKQLKKELISYLPKEELSSEPTRKPKLRNQKPQKVQKSKTTCYKIAQVLRKQNRRRTQLSKLLMALHTVNLSQKLRKH